MNFFGHAAVASRFDNSPAFVFGAMLPDFLGILRLPAVSRAIPGFDAESPNSDHELPFSASPEQSDGIVRSETPKPTTATPEPTTTTPEPTSATPVPTSATQELRRGYDFHHLTDHAFHDSATFQELCRESFTLLQSAGLARGPSRALAHIGIEVLLDETRVMKDLGRVGYLAALDYARARTTVLSPLALYPDSDRARLEGLLDLLLSRGVRPDKADVRDVCERFRRALADRPRLLFGEENFSGVCEWIARSRPRVDESAIEVLNELWRALELRGFRARPLE